MLMYILVMGKEMSNAVRKSFLKTFRCFFLNALRDFGWASRVRCSLTMLIGAGHWCGLVECFVGGHSVGFWFQVDVDIVLCVISVFC